MKSLLLPLVAFGLIATGCLFFNHAMGLHTADAPLFHGPPLRLDQPEEAGPALARQVSAHSQHRKAFLKNRYAELASHQPGCACSLHGGQ